MKAISKDSTDIDVQIEHYRAGKAISLPYAISMTVGTVIGCGIFITVKESFGVFSSQPIAIVALLWVLGGLLSIIGAFCYMELATRMPESGGERVYFKKIIDQKFSILFVFFFVFIIKALLEAALAQTTAKYLISTFNLESEYHKIWLEHVLSPSIILLCCLINCFSKIIAVRAGFVLTALKILAVLILGGGFIHALLNGKGQEWKTPFHMEGFTLTGIADCFIGIIWAYDGSNTIALIAGDMSRPKKDLPLAIMIGFPMVIFLYVLAVISYSAILGFSVAKVSTTIAVSSAKLFLGKATPIISILICCSAIGAANQLLYVLACVSASAGYSGELPKIFSLVHKKTRTPVFSLIVISLVSGIYTFLDFDRILRCCTFLTWIFYFIAYFCLWKIKIQTRKESLTGIFKVPYLMIIPIQITCIFVVAMAFYRDTIGCSISLGVFLFLLVIQYIPIKFSSMFKGFKLQQFLIDIFSSIFGLELAEEEDIS